MRLKFILTGSSEDSDSGHSGAAPIRRVRVRHVATSEQPRSRERTRGATAVGSPRGGLAPSVATRRHGVVGEAAAGRRVAEVDIEVEQPARSAARRRQSRRSRAMPAETLLSFHATVDRYELSAWTQPAATAVPGLAILCLLVLHARATTALRETGTMGARELAARSRSHQRPVRRKVPPPVVQPGDGEDAKPDEDLEVLPARARHFPTDLTPIFGAALQSGPGFASLFAGQVDPEIAFSTSTMRVFIALAVVSAAHALGSYAATPLSARTARHIRPAACAPPRAAAARAGARAAVVPRRRRRGGRGSRQRRRSRRAALRARHGGRDRARARGAAGRNEGRAAAAGGDADRWGVALIFLISGSGCARPSPRRRDALAAQRARAGVLARRDAAAGAALARARSAGCRAMSSTGSRCARACQRRSTCASCSSSAGANVAAALFNAVLGNALGIVARRSSSSARSRRAAAGAGGGGRLALAPAMRARRARRRACRVRPAAPALAARRRGRAPPPHKAAARAPERALLLGLVYAALLRAFGTAPPRAAPRAPRSPRARRARPRARAAARVRGLRRRALARRARGCAALARGRGRVRARGRAQDAALGVPMINALFGGSGGARLAALQLPLLIQLLVGSIAMPYLRA